MVESVAIQGHAQFEVLEADRIRLKQHRDEPVWRLTMDEILLQNTTGC